MKKNNKGFFLIEAIVVITLVTIVMAYVYPNLAKLYDNFENRSKYYDQTEDLYTLKAYYEKNNSSFPECKDVNAPTPLSVDLNFNNNASDSEYEKYFEIESITIMKYLGTSPSTTDYNYRKYLQRMKKNYYDPDACRVIGIFVKKYKDKNNNVKSYKTYASIKVY